MTRLQASDGGYILILRRLPVLLLVFLFGLLTGCETANGPQGGLFSGQNKSEKATPTEPAAPSLLDQILTATGGKPIYEGLGDPNAVVLRAPESAGPVNVGILLPLSGQHANLGQALLDAALMAITDVEGDVIRLIPGDTEGTPEGAEKAAAALLQQGAQLLLGPVFRDSVQAAAPLARERGVQIISFSTDRQIAGNGVFVFGFTPGQQVQRVVTYAIQNGYQNFAGLIPNTPYGDTIMQALEETVAGTDAIIFSVERFSGETNDAAEAVKRLGSYEDRQEALAERLAELEELETPEAIEERAQLEVLDTLGDVEFDAILLPLGGQSLLSVAPLLPYFDINPQVVRVLGTGLWDDVGLGREPALIGGWFAAPAPQTGNAFRQRYQQIFGRPALRISSLAYDATRLAAILAENADFSVSALTTPGGFSGTDGIFRFTTDGVADRGLAVIEIHNTDAQVIDPAPAAFDLQTF